MPKAAPALSNLTKSVTLLRPGETPWHRTDLGLNRRWLQLKRDTSRRGILAGVIQAVATLASCHYWTTNQTEAAKIKTELWFTNWMHIRNEHSHTEQANQAGKHIQFTRQANQAPDFLMFAFCRSPQLSAAKDFSVLRDMDATIFWEAWIRSIKRKMSTQSW